MKESHKDHKVNLGVIGLGSRGINLVKQILEMDDVEIVAVSEVYEDRLQMARSLVESAGHPSPEIYMDYQELLARSDVDGVIISTSWITHAEIGIAAMKAGKYVAIEVGGASSIEECWDLVRTSEHTGKPCTVLSNTCFNRNQLMLLNIVKQGLFGELIHCRGGYQHDRREQVAKGVQNRHYRHDNFIHRNGELYPTHPLAPISKLLNVNRGNRMLSLTSMSSKARGLNEWVAENSEAGNSLHVNMGDIVTTMIKCAHGETILLTHDCSLPRPPFRGPLRIQGTKGIWMGTNHSIHIEGKSPDHAWEDFEAYREKYDHPLWKEFDKKGLPTEGHQGSDYLCLRAFIDSVEQRTSPSIDVYDVAVWKAITPLSEQSIALGSQPVIVPDFTNGKWMNRAPASGGKYSLDDINEDSFK